MKSRNETYTELEGPDTMSHTKEDGGTCTISLWSLLFMFLAFIVSMTVIAFHYRKDPRATTSDWIWTIVGIPVIFLVILFIVFLMYGGTFSSSAEDVLE